MNKIIAALDGMEFKETLDFLSPLQDKLYGIKINHPLLPHLSDYIKDGYKVFVDLKLYDIPNTVEKVIEWLIKQNVYMTTIHFENGEKCLEQISHLTNEIDLYIVSHLTSFPSNSPKQNSIYAHMCKASIYFNFNVILSPLDLPIFNIYDTIHKFKRACPGIRLNDSNDDQVRTSTPKYAIKHGADYLIIGRPLKRNKIECFL